MTGKFPFLATIGFAAAVMLVAAGPVFAQARDAGELHAALHLTEAQDANWRAYQQALEPDRVTLSRRQSAQMMMASLPTPRRIDLLDANMQADLEVMHRQGEATKAFYATLTPEQQKVFDRQTLPAPGGQDGR